MATTSPTPPTATTPLRVPGVIQPTVTDATSSSVTTSPDVTVVGTLTNIGDVVVLPMSGRVGASFHMVSSGAAFEVVIETSHDGGVLFSDQPPVLALYGAGTTYVMLAGGTLMSVVACDISPCIAGACTHLQVRATNVPGAATLTVTAKAAMTQNYQSMALAKATTTRPDNALLIAGAATDTVKAQNIQMANSAPATTDYGVIVRTVGTTTVTNTTEGTTSDAAVELDVTASIAARLRGANNMQRRQMAFAEMHEMRTTERVGTHDIHIMTADRAGTR